MRLLFTALCIPFNATRLKTCWPHERLFIWTTARRISYKGCTALQGIDKDLTIIIHRPTKKGIHVINMNMPYLSPSVGSKSPQFLIDTGTHTEISREKKLNRAGGASIRSKIKSRQLDLQKYVRNSTLARGVNVATPYEQPHFWTTYITVQ